MTTIYAAILILGATGSAQRSMEVDQEISGIVVRVVWGAIGDALPKLRGTVGRPANKIDWSMLDMPALRIDGTERTGWRSWLEGVARVGAYAIDARSDGSVGLSYGLRVRRYEIETSTAVSDGRVEKVVDAWWTETVPVGRSTRRIPIHVRFTITANETGTDGIRGTKTVLVGVAIGTADTSDFRCGLVRRIAERQACETLRSELQKALATIQRRGTDWYLGSADLGPVLDGIGAGMRTIGPRLGRVNRGR